MDLYSKSISTFLEDHVLQNENKAGLLVYLTIDKRLMSSSSRNNILHGLNSSVLFCILYSSRSFHSSQHPVGKPITHTAACLILGVVPDKFHAGVIAAMRTSEDSSGGEESPLKDEPKSFNLGNIKALKTDQWLDN